MVKRNTLKEGRDFGEFQVESGKVLITDPCYDRGTWCAGEAKAKNGKWNAKGIMSDEKGWGIRVAELVCRHESVAPGTSLNWKHQDFEVGVDSGQAGVFDARHYKGGEEDDGWYDDCCQQTLREEHGGPMPFGAVSSTGFGDGGYDCFISFNDKKEAVAIKIVFINEEQEEY